MGNVLSLSRKTKGRWGKMKTSPGRVLRQETVNVGYKRVQLSSEGKLKHESVHRLVASAFIPNPKNLPCVNHKDSDRQNNVVDNLEWVTHKENTAHGIKAGNIKVALPRTHCKYGHAFEGNTYKASNGMKGCKICQSARAKKYYQEKKMRQALFNGEAEMRANLNGRKK